MRILHVTDFYAPFLGGVEQHVRTVASALTARGHEVHVATLARPGLAPVEDDGGVTVHRVPATAQRIGRLFATGERTWAPPLPDPEAMWALRRVIRSVRPDVVHGHDWLARSALPVVALERRRRPVAVVTSLHYYTQSCPKKDLVHAVAHGDRAAGHPCSGPRPMKCLRCTAVHYGALKGPVTAVAARVGAAAELRSSDVTIAVSTATADGNRCSGSVSVIGNPVAAAPDRVHPLLERLPETPFILFVGDLRPMKGVDVLLDAYRTLRSRRGSVPPLVLIGKRWPDTPELAADGVQVEDRWPNEAVLSAWERCAVAVVPSVWAEPFGIVVVEAMRGGAPVLASDVGGIPSIARDGIESVLVPPSDPGALAAALERLVDDVDLRERLGAAARVRAQDFTADRVAAEIEAAYASARTLRTDAR